MDEEIKFAARLPHRTPTRVDIQSVLDVPLQSFTYSNSIAFDLPLIVDQNRHLAFALTASLTKPNTDKSPRTTSQPANDVNAFVVLLNQDPLNGNYPFVDGPVVEGGIYSIFPVRQTDFYCTWLGAGDRFTIRNQKMRGFDVCIGSDQQAFMGEITNCQAQYSNYGIVLYGCTSLDIRRFYSQTNHKGGISLSSSVYSVLTACACDHGATTLDDWAFIAYSFADCDSIEMVGCGASKNQGTVVSVLNSNVTIVAHRGHANDVTEAYYFDVQGASNVVIQTSGFIDTVGGSGRMVHVGDGSVVHVLQTPGIVLADCVVDTGGTLIIENGADRVVTVGPYP